MLTHTFLKIVSCLPSDNNVWSYGHHSTISPVEYNSKLNHISSAHNGSMRSKIKFRNFPDHRSNIVIANLPQLGEFHRSFHGFIVYLLIHLRFLSTFFIILTFLWEFTLIFVTLNTCRVKYNREILLFGLYFLTFLFT